MRTIRALLAALIAAAVIGVVAPSAAEAAGCDPATGRVPVPTLHAPPCVTPAAGAGEVVVAIVLEPDAGPPLTGALFGDGDPVADTWRDYGDLFARHWDQHGGWVRLEFVAGDRGRAGEVAAAAAGLGASIAVWPVPPADFPGQVAQRGIVCVCGSQHLSIPQQDGVPMAWGTQMDPRRAWLHRAEYLGKRLAPGNAVHAGDPVLHRQKRVIAVVHDDFQSQADLDAFAQAMHARGEQATPIAYSVDAVRATAEAQRVAALLKEAGATTVMFVGDPLFPAHLTHAATALGLRPEWVMGASSLVETTFFGRLYDQTQWSRAFGITLLEVPHRSAHTDHVALHVWHHGTQPKAPGAARLAYEHLWIVFTALHMSGGDASPVAIRNGLHAYPASGGGPTRPRWSFGPGDPTATDDMAQVWWDATAYGDSEAGLPGSGMLRYVDGGRRHTLGAWPDTAPDVFNTANTVTRYEQLPSEDRSPAYAHTPH